MRRRQSPTDGFRIEVQELEVPGGEQGVFEDLARGAYETLQLRPTLDRGGEHQREIAQRDTTGHGSTDGEDPDRRCPNQGEDAQNDLGLENSALACPEPSELRVSVVEEPAHKIPGQREDAHLVRRLPVGKEVVDVLLDAGAANGLVEVVVPLLGEIALHEQAR